MTATTFNERLLSRRVSGGTGVAHWGGQAVIAALPSLLAPKCAACLHVYAWLVAWLFGTQVELCGGPGLSWGTVVGELAMVFAYLMAAQRICRALGHRLITCSNGCEL